ncbi:MAG: TolC family protein [Alphaproteobacteria bacterium]|nr:TolC family protein [Alphaproteobacteria bacterium]
MRKLFCGLLCVLMAIPNAFALDLSFEEAVNKIVAESNDLKKADANVQKAKAQLGSLNAGRWMSIDGTVSYMNLIDPKHPTSSKGIELPSELGAILNHSLPMPLSEIPDNMFMAGVEVTQPIYTFGKIGNAVDAMHDAIDMSKSAKELTMREVKYAAANLYWTAKMTDGIVAASERNLNNARAAKKKLTAAGRANRSNLIKIESDIATKEIDLSNAQFDRDTAYNMLKIMAGIDENEEIVLTDGFPDKFEPLATKELKSNPQWDIYQKQIKMYEANASSKRAGGYPTLAAVGSYSYYALGTDIGNMFEKEGGQSAYWGLALKVPLFNGGLHSANATIEAMNAEAAHQELDKSKKLLRHEYNNAVNKYKHLCDNLDKLNEAHNLTQKAYDVSANRFAAGQTSAVELSDVAGALYRMDMALLNAKYNILMAGESVKKLGE